MFCRHCGVTLPDESRFCNKCGKPQAEGGATTPPPLPSPATAPAKAGETRPPAPAPRPAAPPPENELWTGAISPRAMLGSFAVAALWCVACLCAVLAVPKLRVRPVLFIALAAAVLPFCYVYGVYGWEKMRVRYRLTTARLFRREGVLFRRSSELELVRVDDVTVEQSLFDRVFNTGSVIVSSTDTSDPVLRIESIDRPHEVKEQLRNATLARRKGVSFVERI
jgi:membrane protein YdbS with pleckstrin-like domain